MNARGAALALASLLALVQPARAQDESARAQDGDALAFTGHRFPQAWEALEPVWGDLRAQEKRLARAVVARVDLDVESLEGALPPARVAWITMLDRALGRVLGELGEGRPHRLNAASVEVALDAVFSDAVVVAGADRLFPRSAHRTDSTVHPARCRREERGKQALRDYVVVAHATALRLRQDEVNALGGDLFDALARADAETVRALRVERIDAGWSEVLTPERKHRLTRMAHGHGRGLRRRSDRTGDELELARGRYPEDDFVLEAIAVVRVRGWDRSALARLERLGTWLGRRQRRASVRRSALGSPRLSRPAAKPCEHPLWVDYLALLEEEYGGPRDPGPVFTGEAELVEARAALVHAALTHVAHLDRAQREAVAPSVLEYTRQTLRARPHAQDAAGFALVLDELSLSPVSSTKRRSRHARALCDALREALGPVQLRALCLDPKP